MDNVSLELYDNNNCNQDGFYKQAVENSPNPIFSIDRKGIIRNWNRACETNFQYICNIIGNHIKDILFDSSQYNYVEAMTEDVFSKKISLSNIDITYKGKNGSKIFMISGLYPIFDDGGEVCKCVLANTNVTDRKLIQEELKNSEERLKILFEYAPDGYYLSDLKGAFIDGNRAAENIVGYQKDELIGKNFLDSKLLSRSQLAKASELLVRNVMGQSTGPDEFILNRKDGSNVVVEVRTFPVSIKGQNLILGNVRDITEHKKADEALAESEKRYRTIFDLSPEVILLLDKKGNIININGRTQDWIGVMPEEIINKNILSLPFITKKSKLIAIENLLKRMKGTKLPPYELEFIAKNGEKRIGRVVANKINDENGKIMYDLVIIDDITEQKKAQDELKKAHDELDIKVKERTKELTKTNEELLNEISKRKQIENVLRESEEKLRMIIESSPDAITIISPDGSIIECNQAKVLLHELSMKEEIIGKKYIEFISPKDYQKAKLSMDLLKKEGLVRNAEFTFLAKNGREFPAEVSANVVRDASGNPLYFVSIAKDITERKMLEMEHIKASKVDSVGILAGGIAHDSNNILTIIMGNAAILSEYIKHEKKSDETMELIEDIEKACIQAKNLTQQLLSFCKGSLSNRNSVDIKKVLKDWCSICLSGKQSSCVYSIQDDLWNVYINEGQINQVINNIIINADQAMPNGGLIKVSAENVNIKKNNNINLKNGEYVKISIQDQGVGISKENLLKIFDPYFTTKENGNGLGLATSYSIIKNHGGHIDVESQVGLGTAFHIYIPTDRKEKHSEVLAKEAKAIKGNGRILVMDDEPRIRQLCSQILSTMGFYVETAQNGNEALELYKARKGSDQAFDIVVMDLIIPGGHGGRETIQKLLEYDSKAKAIVASGSSNDPCVVDFENYGFKGAIVKPFQVMELGTLIQGIIAGSN